MPEAAEVETLARQLSAHVPFVVSGVSVGHVRAVRQHDVRCLDRLIGVELSQVSRFGKWLTLSDAAGRLGVAFHLRMSGRLLISDDVVEVPTHGHVRFDIESSSGPGVLWFIDPRTFGEVRLTDGPDWFPRFVPDVADGLDPRWRESRFRRSTRSIKSLLLDQNALVAGVGNYMCDEVCHAAGIDPARPALSLSDAECDRLAGVMPGIFERFAALRGTALADEGWRDLYGELGAGATELRVHGRAECGTCGSLVERLKVAGRGTSVCRSCQV